MRLGNRNFTESRYFDCSLTGEEKLVYAARERIFAHLPWIALMLCSSGRITGVL